MSVRGSVSELTILRGDEEMTVRLARQFIVGSRPDADLVLPEAAPTQFIINPGRNGALMLVFEQPAPVRVNGAPARQAQRLTHGDSIDVFGVRLTYSSPSDSNPEVSLSREPTPRSSSVGELRSSLVDSQNMSWFTTEPESESFRAFRTLYRLTSLALTASSESALLEGALELALEGARGQQGAVVGRGENGEVVPMFVRRPADVGSAPSFALDQVLVALSKGHTSVAGPPDHPPTLCVPIVRQSSPPEGALCIKRGDDEPAFSTQEVELIVAVGRQLGAALDRVRMIKTLRSNGLELSRLQRRHEAVLRAISEGLVLVSADGVFEPLSLRGRQLLTQLLGREPRSGERASEHEALADLVASASRGDDGLIEELEGADGRVIRVSATRVEDLDAVVLVMSDVSAQRELEERTREAEARLLTDMVRVREQRRIGQDLHDGVCQQLVGLQMLAKGIERELALAHRPEASKVAEMGALLRQTAEEARSLAKGLTAVALQERSFVLALEDLVATYRQLAPRINITLETTGTLPALDAEVATQVYHVVQEALSNACKHSGASAVGIFLTCASNGVIVAIEDDGAGLPPNAERKGGMGLGNMRNRARMIGATLEIGPGARGGTRVMFALRTDLGPSGGVRGA